MAQDETVIDPLLDVPPPRGQHHAFAHRALPEAAFADLPGLLDALAGADAETLLAEMWAACGRAHPEKEDRVEPQGLAASVETLPCGQRVAVVTLPPAERITEAHMAAAVLGPSKKLLGIFKGRPQVRYFTLEFGYTDQKTERTALCEWTFGPGGEISHRNYGDLPAPEKDAFLEIVNEKVKPNQEA